MIAGFRAGRTVRMGNPLVLHGPCGTGKSHLAAGLVHELTRLTPLITCQHISADDLKASLNTWSQGQHAEPEQPDDDSSAGPAWLAEARQCDFLALEDLHHLPERAAEAIVRLLDYRQARRLPTLVTSRHGPRQLALANATRCRVGLPARLTSRLAAGLVVALDSPGSASRLLLIQEFAQRRQLAVAPEILKWLATNLTGGGRQLDGAIGQLDTLTRLHRQPLKLADVRSHFRAQVDAVRPSVERIVAQVSGYFHVDPRELLLRRRVRAILVPRQVGMYLARQLTRLSLAQIGSHFGGHDHSTVLHACRKVEQALAEDAVLSGAVKQLQAELA
ncbi:MAG: DnaA/Hda family protein [Gemmataceae bacterium]|nr:DnaA/Hda family protein [Gemmataceae bacterium]